MYKRMIYKHDWGDHKSLYFADAYGLYKLTFFMQNGLRVACLQDLIVFPEYRGEGVGNRLLSEATAHAVTESCDALFLWPSSEPWVAEWYKRRGFVPSDLCVNENGDWCLVLKL